VGLCAGDRDPEGPSRRQQARPGGSSPEGGPGRALRSVGALGTSRAELVEATGSRYAPASPCDGLGQIEAAPAPCVFVGKPCDVAAAHRAARLNPALEARLGLSIAIFCAGTPSTSATLDFIRSLGIEDPTSVESVRYRGRGWPGLFRAQLGPREVTESYAASWQVLQSRRQWRCYVCADHTGEFADVAVGDPWYRQIPEGEPGRSLVLARTDRGRAFIERAVAEGYLVLESADPGILAASQPELLKTRGAVWGRILATRLLGVAAPRYRGMPMLRFWLRELSLWEKVQSVAGTIRRVFRKRLRQRLALAPFRTGDAKPTDRRS
jgi:coenzyme F420 hydrogenase subunit beta